MTDDDRVEVKLNISGPNVTLEEAQGVVEATRDLFNALQESIGLPADVEVIGELQRMCDGCGKTVPATNDLPAGWESIEGMDYCPECMTTGRRAT